MLHFWYYITVCYVYLTTTCTVQKLLLALNYVHNREQQQMILKLETEKHQLQLKNETLLLSNSKLQTKLQWSETLQSVERQQVLCPLYLYCNVVSVCHDQVVLWRLP